MAEITLTAKTPLDGQDVSDGACRMREVTDIALVSLAIPLDGEKVLARALKSALGLTVPDPKISSTATDARAIRTSPDQILLLLGGTQHMTAGEVGAKLKGTGYVTDQTDSWVMCELSGAGARSALERLCPLDLHNDTFPVDAAARTVMEHMSAIILRTGADTYLLMSASSSARSFAHAITQSMRYVADD